MIVAIVQARMSSTRLPGKVLLEVMGKPLLWHMIERVRKSRYIDKIVIATTTNFSDDPIVTLAKKVGVDFYRGSEHDVLSRYFEAADKFGAEIIVRLTSDCPLIDPDIINSTIELYLKFNGKIDFVGNTVPPPSTYPDGMDVEVFGFSTLKKTHESAKLPSEREHVTFYMWKNSEFKTKRLDCTRDLSAYRLTVDYPDDYKVIEFVLENLYESNKTFTLEDIISLLHSNSKYLPIQDAEKRYSGWQPSLLRDKKASNHQSSNELDQILPPHKSPTSAKKNALMCIGSAYNFRERIMPLIKPLNEKFNLSIILDRRFLAPGEAPKIKEMLEMNRANNLILFDSSRFLFLVEIKKAIRTLKDMRFDIYIGQGTIHPFEYYPIKLLLSENAKKYIIWWGMTYYRDFNAPQLSPQKSNSNPLLRRILRITPKKVYARIRAIFNRFNSKIKSLPNKRFEKFVFGFGRDLSKLDKQTQIGSIFDTLILSDPLEVSTHKKIFPHKNVILTHPEFSQNCTCNSSDKPTKIALLGLNEVYTNKYEIPDGLEKSYANDIESIQQMGNYDRLDIRPHPRDESCWSKIIKRELNMRGINCQIVEKDTPIRETICAYSLYISAGSNSLRDARVACKYIPVIGLYDPSLIRFRNPLYTYGASEGIFWMKDNNLTEEALSCPKMHNWDNRPSILSIIQ